jgi:hypothetical protein
MRAIDGAAVKLASPAALMHMAVKQ